MPDGVIIALGQDIGPGRGPTTRSDGLPLPSQSHDSSRSSPFCRSGDRRPSPPILLVWIKRSFRRRQPPASPSLHSQLRSGPQVATSLRPLCSCLRLCYRSTVTESAGICRYFVATRWQYQQSSAVQQLSLPRTYFLLCVKKLP
jgi:hypothetical protein